MTALYSHYNTISINTLEHFNVRRYNYSGTCVSLVLQEAEAKMRSYVLEEPSDCNVGLTLVKERAKEGRQAYPAVQVSESSVMASGESLSQSHPLEESHIS